MFSANLLESQMKMQKDNIFSHFSSAFKPISLSLASECIGKEVENSGIEINLLKPLKPVPINVSEKVLAHDVDAWSKEEIKKLFTLYDCHGPQWKIMSQ